MLIQRAEQAKVKAFSPYDLHRTFADSGRIERMQRIQEKRRMEGWRKPFGVIRVARRRVKGDGRVGTPNYWGNPYEIKFYGRARAMAMFRYDVEALSDTEREAWLAPLSTASALMCWCRLNESCHADVLLEYLEKSASKI